MPWMLDLARRRYSDRFDLQATEQWFRNIVLKGPLLFWPVRSDNAFLVAMLSCVPWLPADLECNIALLCADDGCLWEAMALARASVDWARRRRCTTWRCVSETDYDLGPLALRLGADEVSARYVLRL